MKLPFATFFAVSVFLGCSIGSAQAKPPRPLVVVVNVGSESRKPPTAAFMQEGPINPSTTTLQAEGSPVQASPTMPTTPASLVTAAPRPVRSFRTLAEAAKAGVNPIPSIKLKGIKTAKSIKPHSFPLYEKSYFLTGTALALLGLAYVLFAYRKRRPSAT